MHVAQPICVYERSDKLRTFNFQNLGGVVSGLVKFEADPSKYVDKLVELDEHMADDARVFSEMGTGPELQRNKDKLVHSIAAAQAACKQSTAGAGAGFMGSEFTAEYVEASTGTKPSTVKQAEIFGLVTKARDKGLDIPTSEDQRPGKETLGAVKDCFRPAPPKDGGDAKPVSYPRSQVQQIDKESKGKYISEKSKATAPQVLAAYKMHLRAALIIGHDVDCPKSLSPYAPGEHTGFTPRGGHVLMDEASVKMHLAPIEAAVEKGEISAEALIKVLEAVNEMMRERVSGRGDPYTKKLSPAAAARDVVDLLKGMLDAAEAKPAPDKGKDQRTAEEIAEAKRVKAERKAAERAAKKGKGKGGIVYPGGGKGKASYAEICRDFQNGNCTRAVCKYAHVMPSGGWQPPAAGYAAAGGFPNGAGFGYGGVPAPMPMTRAPPPAPQAPQPPGARQ
jgi:hypothetical protein